MANKGSAPDRIPFNPSRMRQARQQKELTIEEAAQLSSVNKMTLQRYESGDIRAISPERLRRLATVYETSPAWLTGISSQQEFLFREANLLFSPLSAEQPSHLGQRLLVCLNFLGQTSDDR